MYTAKNRTVSAILMACIVIGILLRLYWSRSVKAVPPPPSEAQKSVKLKRVKRRSKTPEAEDETLPQFIMLLGIPGSGKSTWAKEYVFRCDASFTIVSSDAIRKTVTGTINDQTKNTEVWDIVLNQCQGLLAKGCNVILDATNTQTEKRRQFVKRLPLCRKYIKMFAINKAIAKSRIAKDIERGIDRSNVPDAVIDVMYRQFQDSIAAVREEGWKIR